MRFKSCTIVIYVKLQMIYGIKGQESIRNNLFAIIRVRLRISEPCLGESLGGSHLVTWT